MHGLYFGLDKHVKLCVEVEDYIFFGVRCASVQRSREFRSLAASLSGWESGDGWPLFQYPPTDLNLKHTSREQLSLLVNEESRGTYVGEVVSGASALWNKLKESGLVETG